MGARSHGGLGGAAAGGERDGDWALGLGEEDSKEDKVALEVGSHTGIGLCGPNLLLRQILVRGTSGFRVFRVPGFNTRITRNNFGYRSLLPEIVVGLFGFGFFGYGFGFFGYGFRASGNMPSHSARGAKY